MGATFEEHLAERAAQNYATTRRWSPNHERVGLIGEKTLAEYFGVEQDLRDKKGGDGGGDLRLRLVIGGKYDWYHADAKASAKDPWCLPVDCEKCEPTTIYVLVIVVDLAAREGKCLGWVWGHEAARYPAEPWNEAIVHKVPRAVLHPMRELDECFVTADHAPYIS